MMVRSSVEEMFLNLAKAYALNNWEFSFNFDKTEKELNGPASIEIFKAHNKATLRIAKDKYDGWNVEYTQKICTHELVHCMITGLFILGDLIAMLHIDNPQEKELFDTMYEREHELAVDHLTKALMV